MEMVKLFKKAERKCNVFAVLKCTSDLCHVCFCSNRVLLHGYFFLALGSLKALADIICEYPSIHKRYTVKCCGGGRGNVLILETFALIT